MTALLEPDVLARDAIRDAIGDVSAAPASFDELTALVRSEPDLDTVVLGPSVDSELAIDFADLMRASNPTLGVVVVRRRIDATLLTQALRAGVREVVAERDLPGVGDAVRRSQKLTFALRNPGQTRAPEADEPTGHLFTVFSPKGGAGKTTLAVNLGVALVGRGYRTLVLDLDLAFGDVPISLGLRPEHGFQEVVALGDRLDASALERLVTVHESGLHVLAPPADPGAHEQATPSLVERLLKVAATQYQYVIADTPPSLDERTITAMEASEAVFLLTTLDIPSLKNAKIAVETLRLVNFPVDRLRVVMNRSDSKVGLDLGDVERSLGVPVVGFIPSSRLVPATTNRGVPIVTEKPKHAVSTSIQSLAGAQVIKEPRRADRRGLLGRRREA
jgi:pilus assembly protein CpaE